MLFLQHFFKYELEQMECGECSKPLLTLMLYKAPAGGVTATALEGDALASPLAPTSTSTRWGFVLW
jgi:hypothetical protein